MTDWYNTMDGMNVKERLAQTKILTPAWLIEPYRQPASQLQYRWETGRKVTQ